MPFCDETLFREDNEEAYRGQEMLKRRLNKGVNIMYFETDPALSEAMILVFGRKLRGSFTAIFLSSYLP